MIDLAHHRGKARKALHEVLAFDDAINATMKLLKASGILENTLVIVTSDHSHTLSISGYPARGNSILGMYFRLFIRENNSYNNVASLFIK